MNSEQFSTAKFGCNQPLSNVKTLSILIYVMNLDLYKHFDFQEIICIFGFFLFLRFHEKMEFLILEIFWISQWFFSIYQVFILYLRILLIFCIQSLSESLLIYILYSNRFYFFLIFLFLLENFVICFLASIISCEHIKKLRGRICEKKGPDEKSLPKLCQQRCHDLTVYKEIFI